MKKIKVALLGCGDRGCIYADYSLRNPDDMEIVAVVDNVPLKKETARVRYSLPEELAFDSVEAFVEAGISCDIVIDATMDRAHYPTAMALLNAKYNVLLEKPVCPTKEELLDIQKAAHENGCKVIVCHVLRYTPFYSAVKSACGRQDRQSSQHYDDRTRWYGALYRLLRPRKMEQRRRMRLRSFACKMLPRHGPYVLACQ